MDTVGRNRMLGGYILGMLWAVPRGLFFRRNTWRKSIWRTKSWHQKGENIFTKLIFKHPRLKTLTHNDCQKLLNIKHQNIISLVDVQQNLVSPEKVKNRDLESFIVYVFWFNCRTARKISVIWLFQNWRILVNYLIIWHLLDDLMKLWREHIFINWLML